MSFFDNAEYDLLKTAWDAKFDKIEGLSKSIAKSNRTLTFGLMIVSGIAWHLYRRVGRQETQIEGLTKRLEKLDYLERE